MTELRKFTAEHAKPGTRVTYDDYNFEYVAGPDTCGFYIFKMVEGLRYYRGQFADPVHPDAVDIFLTPLGYLDDGIPVYDGDIVYFIDAVLSGQSRIVSGIHSYGNGGESIGFTVYDGKNSNWVSFGSVTTIKPKDKKYGWVNVYRAFGSVTRIFGEIHESEYLASRSKDVNYHYDYHYVDTIKIDWKE